ncbi:MAG: HDIG domain-containing protein [Bacteroidales bacterium]|nr:HDIG domain-containing protein [Bacteroidales bacterium]
MEKINFPKKFKVYVPLILIFVVLLLLMPRSLRFGYDYTKGSPWKYETLIAQFDFPILKTDEQYQRELENAGARVIPYYRYDDKVSAKTAEALSAMDFGLLADVGQAVSDAVSEIYSIGVISVSAGQDAEDGVIYVQKDRRAFKVPVSEVCTLDKAYELLREKVSAVSAGHNVDSLYDATGLGKLIEPNLVFDQQTTDLVHEENFDHISRTQGVVRSGMVIVSEEEMVTAEIEQLLDSYKAEYEANVGYLGPRPLQWIGNGMIAFFLVLVLFLAIYYCNSRIFDEFNKYLYILMVFLLSAVCSSVVAKVDPNLFYMMPFMLIVFYQLAFFSRRMVFSVYFISLLPMLIFAPDGMELFLIYLVAGTVGILVFERFNKGWLQFVTAFILFVVMVMVWLAFRFVEGMTSVDYHTIFDMALGAVLSVAGYPLIYLFEKIFRLVSTSKLVELSDTSNPLLRMLADKAPGTFQHSLQVMNLADAVARSVDANVPLIRTAALYHDVGKIANPQCFTENETPGVKYHAGLSPKESSQEIIRHVSDGVALAEKYGLPEIVREFITTHHGTTPTAYFLNTYLNAGGDPEQTADFYYDGVKPTTKEQVILMFCDAVEAASRALKDYSQENISALVDRIVDGKISDGQLVDADISLKEIAVIKETMKTYLQQMYHSRVAYPKRRKNAQ